MGLFGMLGGPDPGWGAALGGQAAGDEQARRWLPSAVTAKGAFGH
jgi:hypothetical protein